MTKTNEELVHAVDCPYMSQPCPQGDWQGMQCQFRAAQQDFDPVARFNDFEVIYCAVCKQHVRVATILRAASGPEKAASGRQ
jgi:hypothetical protein